jgi:hypothetical protein
MMRTGPAGNWFTARFWQAVVPRTFAELGANVRNVE